MLLRICYIAFAIACFTKSYSQDNQCICSVDTLDEVFKVVQSNARFPGCENIENLSDRIKCSDDNFNNFLTTHLIYPNVAFINQIQGIVVVRFVVEKSGCISDIEIVRDIGAGCGDEAVRVCHLMNQEGIQWISAEQSGRKVRQQLNVQIRFDIKNPYPIEGDTIIQDTLDCLEIATTQISNIEQEFNEIKIFPNPVLNHLTLNVFSIKNKQIELKLFNSFGQFLYSEHIFAINGNNMIELELRPLPNGVYLLQVLDSKMNNTKATKVIIINGL